MSRLVNFKPAKPRPVSEEDIRLYGLGKKLLDQDPVALWQSLSKYLGLPSDNMPVRQKRRRVIYPTHDSSTKGITALLSRRRRQSSVLKFAESVDQSLSQAPANETALEARLRVLQDCLTRSDAHDNAGLRFTTDRRIMRSSHGFRYWIEEWHFEARMKVRFERGDF
jgi:hypothetical protein